MKVDITLDQFGRIEVTLEAETSKDKQDIKIFSVSDKFEVFTWMSGGSGEVCLVSLLGSQKYKSAKFT
jgi:hypothetical protein